MLCFSCLFLTVNKLRAKAKLTNWLPRPPATAPPPRPARFLIVFIFAQAYKWSSKCKWSQIVQQMIPWLETIPRLCHKQSPDQKWSPLNNQGKCKDSGIWTVDLNLCNGFFRTVKLKKLSTLCVDSESLIVYWTNHNKVKGKWEETAAVCGLLIFPCYRTQ